MSELGLLSSARLRGSFEVEQNDEWALARRYIGYEPLKTPRQTGPCVADPRPGMEAAGVRLEEGEPTTEIE